MRLSHLSRTAAALAAAATLAAPAALSSTAQASSSHPEGMHVFRTKAARPVAGASTNNDLYYHGGIGGVGVETGVDKVYLVEWGFNGSDPSGEVGIQTRFFSGVGGSSWNNSVTQYCQGVGSGTYFCGTSGTHATNPSGMYGGIMVDKAAQEVSVDGRPIQLTAKEFALLAYLCDRRGKVLSRDHLLARVWGNRYDGGPRTVDIHVRRLRAKLGEALPLDTLRGSGYKLRVPDAAGAEEE